MDIDQLMAHSRHRFDHATAKRLLQEKYQARLVFGYNGGMWRATPEMITFLSLYRDQDVIVPDLYETPVKFNARVMRDLMQARWQEQMNAWLIEWEQQQPQR